jgi:hypothetical protein
MRRLLRKSVVFFENIDFNHRPYFASATPPAMVEFGRFGILADGRSITFGRRAFDTLMALIETSGVVVSVPVALAVALWLDLAGGAASVLGAHVYNTIQTFGCPCNSNTSPQSLFTI